MTSITIAALLFVGCRLVTAEDGPLRGSALEEARIKRRTEALFGREYSPVRLQRFCEKYRECHEASWRCDVDALLRMLCDPERWVRHLAYVDLVAQSNLRVLRFLPEGETLDPHADYATVASQVDRLRKWLADSPVPLRLDRQPWTDERRIALARQGSYPDDEPLGVLAELARAELFRGNREALFLLRALVGHERVAVRADALRTLIVSDAGPWQTNAPDRDLKGLLPPDYDADVVARWKAEWLPWWEKNKDTYQPPKRHYAPGLG